MGESVGFVGLGAMGAGMAHNIQQYLSSQGASLLVHNRTKSKAEQLLADGATWGDSPAELAQRCSIVLTMLTNDAALTAVFDEFLAGKPRPGTIFSDCSTVGPDTTEKLAARAAEAGVHFFVSYHSSPVFGRPDVARAGKLLVVSAGAPDTRAKVKPYLEAMGRGVLVVGDSPRSGSAMKLVGNFYIASAIEAFAEGMTLADRNDISRDAFMEFQRACFPSPISIGYAERMAKNQMHMDPAQPGLSATNGLKDVTLMQKLGKASGVPLPIVDTIVAHLQDVVNRGAGESLEWVAAVLPIREAAGTDSLDNYVKP